MSFAYIEIVSSRTGRVVLRHLVESKDDVRAWDVIKGMDIVIALKELKLYTRITTSDDRLKAGKIKE